MKTVKFVLMLFLITAFGTSDLFAQTVDTTAPTTKTKRKYTKKALASTTTMVTANGSSNSATTDAKPKRKYTKKTNIALTPALSATTTDNTAPKPKRTYTRKTVMTVTPALSATTTTTDNTTVKPKRTYTKNTTVNSSIPASNPVRTANQYTPTASQTQPAFAHNTVKQSYKPSNGGDYNGHQILVGPKGGKYYINKNGNKTYIK